MKNFNSVFLRLIIILIFSLIIIKGCTCGAGILSYNIENNPTAVWAYPDGNIVSGSVRIGVVAYYSTGISRVDFSVDGALRASVTEETLNPDTGEYEYFFVLNTTTPLITDGEHRINAVVIPNPSTDASRTLTDLIIHVANSTTFNTYYVDDALGNDSNNGQSATPWKTLGRALGTQWETYYLTPRATGGDTVYVRTGTYDLPDDQYGTHDKYITIKPDGAATVTIKNGSLRSPFIKFEGTAINNIRFRGGSEGVGIYAYSSRAHHYWFKNCTYTGYGKIWPDTVSLDEFIRSSDNSHNVIVENCTVHDANQGISLIGLGNYIIRNCEVYDQNGDGMKFQGDNILITGNEINNVAPPKAWSVSKNLLAPPYDCSGITLRFYYSTNSGSTYNYFEVDLNSLGAGQSATDVINFLNSNTTFTGYGFTASLSPSYSYLPIPAGKVYIEKIGTETHRFYITGGETVFNFSDNRRALNDISSTYPARYSTEHCDYIANDGRSSSNVVIRNNEMYNGSAQGLKLDLIGGRGYKRNIAIVNNLLAGGKSSSTMFYMNYRGSGSPASYISYYNILFVHNTVIRPSNATIRACISIDMSNPVLSNIVIKNNIIGHYIHGDWPFTSAQGISDYNFFTSSNYSDPPPASPSYGSGLPPNTNSIVATTHLGNDNFDNVNLINNWNFSLFPTSQANGNADPSLNIKYDINWNIRSSTTPSMGCHED